MLYNELEEDAEGLHPYLHIRTYQHTEIVQDSPEIKALNDSGEIIKYPNPIYGYEYEIRSSDVLYYIFDKAHYFVTDAAFQSGTYYWYKQLNAIYSAPATMVFLTATPVSLDLYLHLKDYSLSDCCMEFIARYFVDKDISRERWISYLSSAYKHYKSFQPYNSEGLNLICSDEIQRCKDPYAVLYRIIEDSYKSHDKMLTYHYTDTQPVANRYSYLSEYYFNKLTSLSGEICKSVNNGEKWLISVRQKKAAEALKTILTTKGCDSFIVTSQVAQKYDGKPRQRKSFIKDNLDALILHQ